MTVGYNNIFPIPDAEEYSCSIYEYRRGHSELYIEVANYRESPFYLLFAAVMYFSGPPHWQGVNFQLLEKPEKHMAALRIIDFFTPWPEDFLLQRTEVYTVGIGFVTIIAGAVERLEKIPVWEGIPKPKV